MSRSEDNGTGCVGALILNFSLQVISEPDLPIRQMRPLPKAANFRRQTIPERHSGIENSGLGGAACQ